MRILITGATGFIGRSLLPRLQAEGHDAIPYHGRINDPLSLRDQLDGMATVIHLAGAEARGRKRLLQHVDIEGAERLLEECHRAGVQHLIIPSRIGADPNALHPLLQAKGEVERLVRNSGLPFTILRAATLYGRGDRFTEIMTALAIWSWPFVWMPGGGSIAMQPLWVEDYARCIVAALSRPDLVGQTITLAGEERLYYRDIVRLLLAAINLRRIPVRIPHVLLHPITTLVFSWWRWPPVSHYFVDRFFVPEVTEYDSVYRHFGFRPARISETITYLRRPGLRWRILRR
ncbi:MAG: SDR family oxidoreductase [Anaerolineae bacterium]